MHFTSKLNQRSVLFLIADFASRYLKYLLLSGAGHFRCARVAVVLLLLLPAVLPGQQHIEYTDTACTEQSGATLTTSFVNPSLPASDVTLSIYGVGDFSASNEYFDIYSENSGFLARFSTGNDCGPADTLNITVPADSFATWAADGIVNFSNQASSGVNVCSPVFCAAVVARYHPVTAPDDAGAIGINQNGRICAGNDHITAQIQNFGTNQINSVQVNWSVNGSLQSPVTVGSTLDTVGGSGNSSIDVSLGSFNFAPGGSYDFKVWTSQPNSNADTINFNDTLTHTVVVSLNGTYTIGGSSPDYPDFTSAVSDLHNRGVCGPVNFQVADGSYNEQIAINSVPGASATNHITFAGTSGDSSFVTLHHNSSSSNNYVVRLNNAGYITFRDMTLEATNSSYARVVEIEGQNDSVSFYSNHLKGSGGSSTTNRALVYYSNSAARHQLFRNNRFESGSYAIYYDASGSTNHLRFVNTV